MMRNIIILSICLFVVTGGIIGCSMNENSSVAPQISNEMTSDLDPSVLADERTSLAGIYTMEIDLLNNQAIVKPDRTPLFHVNVRNYIGMPGISIKSYDSIANVIDLDVTLNNTTNIAGYDVRLIIFTDDVGHMLIDPDDWTGLWDIPGGMKINPFRAYAKAQPLRKFAAQTQNTENVQIYLPNGNSVVKFAIDASIGGNCEEPFEISDFTQEILYDYLDAEADIEITVKGWDELPETVYLHCPAITDKVLVEFTNLSAERYGLTLVNETGTYSGNYIGYIVAYSYKQDSIALYDQVFIAVSASGRGWARTWGGSGDEGESKSMAIDSNGDVYICGCFEYWVDFDPGPNVDIHSSLGLWDTFVCKYSSDGRFIWARTWGGPGLYDTPRGIAVDNSGVYVCGGFHYSIDFDPGPGYAYYEVHGPEFNHRDAYLNKLDKNGNYVWTKTWGGSGGWDVAYDVVFDGVNKLYLDGLFNYDVDFNPNTGIDLKVASGEYDSYVMQLDTNGNYYWTKTWGGTNMTAANCLTLDGTNNIYICGWYDGETDFDPTSNIAKYQSQGGWDAFLSKFDIYGGFKWARAWGSPEDQQALRLNTNSSGDIYVAGSYGGTVDFDPGSGENIRTSFGDWDCFLSRFNPSGDLQQVYTWGSPAKDRCRDICFDGSGNIYTTGFFSQTVDMDPTSGVCELSSNGCEDAFLIKLSSNENFIWARSWGGSGGDNGCDVFSYPNGNAIVYGGFVNTVDFNPGVKIDEHTSNGGADSFLMKILPNGYWE